MNFAQDCCYPTSEDVDRKSQRQSNDLEYKVGLQTKLRSARQRIKKYICPISVTRVKCDIRSTLCWKIGNISGSTDFFWAVIADGDLKLPKLSIHTLVMLQK